MRFHYLRRQRRVGYQPLKMSIIKDDEPVSVQETGYTGSQNPSEPSETERSMILCWFSRK